MTEHTTGTREEWLAARLKLLEREKELTHLSDELAQHRRALPWVQVEKEYTFETGEGTKTLAELFGGRSQLLVYHFMFGPEYKAGCPHCSSIADCFDGFVVHLNHHDVTMLCASRAPLENLLAYRERMGWSFPWVSTLGGDFNFDFNVSFTEEQQREDVEYNYTSRDFKPVLEADAGPIAEFAASVGTDVPHFLQEAPGMSAFVRADGAVYHTYSAYARGLDALWGIYQWLDRAPKGRNEGDPPWPWMRRHDEYAESRV